MSDTENAGPKIGAIEWSDLTVPDAESLSDFYCDVVGWDKSPVSMGRLVLPPGSISILAIKKKGTQLLRVIEQGGRSRPMTELYPVPD